MRQFVDLLLAVVVAVVVECFCFVFDLPVRLDKEHFPCYNLSPRVDNKRKSDCYATKDVVTNIMIESAAY